MATAATPASCLRAANTNSHLLTKTWILTPSHLYYRAGKCTHHMKPFAYSIFAEFPKQNIKRSLSPYKVSYNPSRMSTPPTRRQFHTSSRFAREATESAIPHISVHIAAASSGKQRKYEPEKSTVDFLAAPDSTLGLQAAGNVYQRRRSRPDSGEDAYFVASVGGDSTTIAMGVCDGVGGWSDQGINPADFSHGMCSYMAETAVQWQRNHTTKGEKEYPSLHPKKLLHIGYDRTLEDEQIRAGGATACVAIADNAGRLRTANLGDSGWVQLRLGSVASYSTPQTHAFNTPFQLSKTPPEIMTQAAIFGGLPLNDSPDRADISDTTLQHGDVIVFATDGVWDNLSSQDLLTIVSKLMRERGAWAKTNDKGIVVTEKIAQMVKPTSRDLTENAGQPKEWSLQSVIASHIVGEAKIASMDRKRDGPFAKAVQREYPMDRWHGGKVDDITALVLIAVENGSGRNGSLKPKL